ncbi:MAG: CDP-glycerol glycerophosphotransferase family protein [Acidobacteria bacterium]|jgi:hypothetical protein|nr:CDP-glycerol glycerophosphotransferase family protein [Acidobacteriota bacterium]
MQKIFIAEFASELEGFLNYCRENSIDSSGYLTVALEPQVKAACKEKGLAYTDTLPFFNTVSHRRVLQESHKLTTLIDRNLTFDVEGPGVPLNNKVLLDTFIFYARFYINNYLWIIEVMKGIKEAYEPQVDVEIVVFHEDIAAVPAPAADINPYFTKRNRFVHSLVEKYGRANGMKVEVIKETRPLPPPGELTKPPAGAIEMFLCRMACKLLQMKLHKLSRFPVVFIAAPSYNLDRVCRDIQSLVPGVAAVTDTRPPASVRGYLKLCLKELKKQFSGGGVQFNGSSESLIPVPVSLFSSVGPGPGMHTGINIDAAKENIKESYRKFTALYHGQFVYENCSFRDEFNRKVESDLLDCLGGLLDLAAAQGNFLDYLKPKMVISPVSTGEYQGWAEVARSREIPALVIPQKTLVVPANEIARIEERYIGRAQVTDTFANAAAQSPLVTKYLKWSGYKGNIIETGNLIFARLNGRVTKKKRMPGKKVIVWAPSMKTRKSRRFYVLESIDELLSAMADVFDVVSQLEDVHLIFRIHPGDAITKKQIYTLLKVPDNVSVSDCGSFESVLAMADLLISFSSTAAQEALINHIPILLYDKWHRYNHLDAEEIKNGVPAQVSAVYYFTEKKHLLPGIKWIMEEHIAKKIQADIFKDYAFWDDDLKFDNFINFVEKCLKEKR